MSPSAEDLEGAMVYCTGHYNYGEKGGGYPYRFQKWPRLGYVVKVWRGKQRTLRGRGETVWTVDGKEVESREAALAALFMPPKLSDLENHILALVPDEWADYHNLRDRIAPRSPDHRVTPELTAMMTLKDKGMIEFKLEPIAGVDAFGRQKSRSFIRRTPSVAPEVRL